MNYLPYALASPILMAIANVIQKLVVSDDKIHGGVFAGAFGLLVAILTLPFAIFTEQFSLQMFSLSVILTLFFMTGLYAVAMWGFFTSMKHVPISEIVFLESATPLWVLFGSVLFLGESFHYNKLIGVILVTLGILIAFCFKGTKRWTRYHTLGLASGALYAGAYMTDKYLLHFLPTLFYQVLSFGLPSATLLIFFHNKISDLHYFVVNKKARRIIWSSVFAGLSFYSLFRAYQISGEVSRVNPIFETKALWVMIFGIVLLKERENMFRKVVGIFLALGGILLVNG
ncbi:DMT family transporter [Candidatus Gottesmanbacteria bacterium]|nr:DMT family transporter [Candidatus Gottesmanbacteria bacterium]